MNKTENKLYDALLNGHEGKDLVIKGQNMETGERGERYRVAEDENSISLLYWGNCVATIWRYDDFVTVDTCGYDTRNTCRLINLALRVMEELYGVPYPRASLRIPRNGDLPTWNLDGEWDGCKVDVYPSK